MLAHLAAPGPALPATSGSHAQDSNDPKMPHAILNQKGRPKAAF
jgi:hypothetical protein